MAETRPAMNKRTALLRWSRTLTIVLLFLAAFAAVVLYHTHKPLPPGISYESPAYTDSGVELLYNLSYDLGGTRTFEEQIYSAWYEAIGQAEKWIVLDMFMFARFRDRDQSFPPLSEELKDRLLAQMSRCPEMRVVIVTDEINTSYGSHPSAVMEELKKAGALIVYTDLDPLRDSNPLYSGFWRMFVRWSGESGAGWISNPFSDMEPKVTLRSMLRLFNVKANHRKLLLTEKTGILMSANAHDASFYHGNIGFRFRGGLLREVLKSEKAVIRMSGGPDIRLEPDTEATASYGTASAGEVSVSLITEGKIAGRVEEALERAGNGDKVWLGMFYLADRDIVRRLLDAAARGADVRLVLDPNTNAFGQEKMGLPNIPVAAELRKRSDGAVRIRWYNTGDSQYHAKLLQIIGKEESMVIGGSANFTRRNLDDLNLEADFLIRGKSEAEVMKATEAYFERIWNNEGGVYTVPYEAHAEKLPFLKMTVYALQNLLGFTTF